MKVAGSYLFEAPRDIVWKALQDPEVLAATLPGCDKLELVGENKYDGALNIKIGPVQGKFQGKIQLEDIDEPNGYTMKVDGRGAPGFVKATAQVKLHEEGENTKLDYDSDANVGGRIASVGQRLLDSSAKAIIKQSLEGLNETLKLRAEAAEAPAASAGDEEAPTASAPLPTVEQPTQAEFAAKIAKEVAKDVVPKPVLIGGIVLIVMLIIFFLI